MRKFNVSVNGKSYEVEVEESVATSASAATATPVAPVATRAAAPAPVAVVAKTIAGGTILSSPMPGLILSLAVQSGTMVKKGSKVLVLEAMKMENDINAPADGIITFLVKQGDTVETGTQLASIK